MKIKDIDWNYKNQVSILENLYILLFYFITRKAVDYFGDEGCQCIADACTEYGHYRGGLLALEQKSHDLELNVTNFYGHYDLPRDPRTLQKYIHLDPHAAEEEFYSCHFSNIWKWLEDIPLSECSPIGKIYCDYFHPAMWQGYNTHMKMTLPKIIVKGDEKCSFVTSWDDCPKETVSCNFEGVDTINWHYEDGLYVMNTIYSLLYFFLSNELMCRFGDRGIDCVIDGISTYGTYRGKLLAYIHSQTNHSNSKSSFIKYYDYPDYLCACDTTKEYPAMFSTHSRSIWSLLEKNYPCGSKMKPSEIYDTYMGACMWTGYNNYSPDDER
ncbi:MAG: hypothetical protein PUD93_01320 [Lachnospiraceae bacterium]|nr:hypothetical protein [Lachnospiraceae bacterium]